MKNRNTQQNDTDLTQIFVNFCYRLFYGEKINLPYYG